jgi:DNA-binding transcriptional regulator YdaS (Cro superfamily)
MKRKPILSHSQLIQRYIDAKKLTQTQFAELADVPQGMVSYWINGKRPVSAKAALAIERNTDGVLSRFDLCPDIFRNDTAA